MMLMPFLMNYYAEHRKEMFLYNDTLNTFYL